MGNVSSGSPMEADVITREIESCFVCDKAIGCYPAGRHGFSECPGGALYCETTGNYGSAIFDPSGCNGQEKIVIYVCDECMSAKASKAKYIVDGKLMPFKSKDDLL